MLLIVPNQMMVRMWKCGIVNEPMPVGGHQATVVRGQARVETVISSGAAASAPNPDPNFQKITDWSLRAKCWTVSRRIPSPSGSLNTGWSQAGRAVSRGPAVYHSVQGYQCAY
jgi:hypothetical protein